MGLNSFFRRKSHSPRQDKLRGASLFVDLSAAELAIVDDLVHERSYLKDEVIFDAGEEGEAIYVIHAGEVLICRQGEPESGRIALLGPGSFFGELALLDDAPRSAQARAATACELAVFFRDDFVALLDTHPRIVWQLARHVGGRMRAMALAAGAHQHL